MTYTLRDRCYQILVEWHGKEHGHPLGPSDPNLFDRVTKVLQQEQAMVRGEGRGAPESILIALANEVRGLSGGVGPPVSTERGVPAEFRELGKPNGEILTPSYLIECSEWPFTNRAIFTRNFGAGKPLTQRIKVGKQFAYLYKELSAMWRNNSLKQ